MLTSYNACASFGQMKQNDQNENFLVGHISSIFTEKKKKNEAFKEKNTIPTVKHEGSQVMV